jgi:hypothetical protein
LAHAGLVPESDAGLMFNYHYGQAAPRAHDGSLEVGG